MVNNKETQRAQALHESPYSKFYGQEELARKFDRAITMAKGENEISFGIAKFGYFPRDEKDERQAVFSDFSTLELAKAITEVITQEKKLSKEKEKQKSDEILRQTVEQSRAYGHYWDAGKLTNFINAVTQDPNSLVERTLYNRIIEQQINTENPNSLDMMEIVKKEMQRNKNRRGLSDEDNLVLDQLTFRIQMSESDYHNDSFDDAYWYYKTQAEEEEAMTVVKAEFLLKVLKNPTLRSMCESKNSDENDEERNEEEIKVIDFENLLALARVLQEKNEAREQARTELTWQNENGEEQTMNLREFWRYYVAEDNNDDNRAFLHFAHFFDQLWQSNQTAEDSAKLDKKALLRKVLETYNPPMETNKKRAEILFYHGMTLRRYCFEENINYSAVWHRVQQLPETDRTNEDLLTEIVDSLDDNGQTRKEQHYVYEIGPFSLKHLCLSGIFTDVTKKVPDQEQSAGIDDGKIKSMMELYHLSMAEAFELKVFQEYITNKAIAWEFFQHYRHQKINTQLNEDFFTENSEVAKLLKKAGQQAAEVGRQLRLLIVTDKHFVGEYDGRDMIEMLKEIDRESLAKGGSTITVNDIKKIFVDVPKRFTDVILKSNSGFLDAEEIDELEKKLKQRKYLTGNESHEKVLQILDSARLILGIIPPTQEQYDDLEDFLRRKGLEGESARILIQRLQEIFVCRQQAEQELASESQPTLEEVETAVEQLETADTNTEEIEPTEEQPATAEQQLEQEEEPSSPIFKLADRGLEEFDFGWEEVVAALNQNKQGKKLTVSELVHRLPKGNFDLQTFVHDGLQIDTLSENGQSILEKIKQILRSNDSFTAYKRLLDRFNSEKFASRWNKLSRADITPLAEVRAAEAAKIDQLKEEAKIAEKAEQAKIAEEKERAAEAERLRKEQEDFENDIHFTMKNGKDIKLSLIHLAEAFGLTEEETLQRVEGLLEQKNVTKDELTTILFPKSLDYKNDSLLKRSYQNLFDNLKKKNSAGVATKDFYDEIRSMREFEKSDDKYQWQAVYSALDNYGAKYYQVYELSRRILRLDRHDAEPRTVLKAIKEFKQNGEETIGMFLQIVQEFSNKLDKKDEEPDIFKTIVSDVYTWLSSYFRTLKTAINFLRSINQAYSEDNYFNFTKEQLDLIQVPIEWGKSSSTLDSQLTAIGDKIRSIK